MAWMKVRYRLTGDAPLLMHSGKLADPLSSVAKAIKQVSAKKAKTDADHERMATLEFAGSLYLDSELGPYIPGENIEASIYHAARKTKEGKLAASGLFVPGKSRLDYDGPRDPKGLLAEGDAYRLCVPVGLNGKRVMRTRPIFRAWSVVAEVEYEDTILNLEQVNRWVQTAGVQVGLCDWRPRYGRFTVEKI
jgi:hypothetical protein